jgi:hypothetical protein
MEVYLREQHFKQSRFTGTILSDNTQQISFLHFKVIFRFSSFPLGVEGITNFLIGIFFALYIGDPPTLQIVAKGIG